VETATSLTNIFGWQNLHLQLVLGVVFFYHSCLMTLGDVSDPVIKSAGWWQIKYFLFLSHWYLKSKWKFFLSWVVVSRIFDFYPENWGNDPI